MPSGIDERLLAAAEADRQRQEEMARANELRQERMATADKNRQREISGGPDSYRQAVSASRLEKLKEQVKEKVAAPAKMATGRALQWAWTSLVPSFGLTLIYINLHVFLRQLFPDFFCKLGQEWIPKMAGTGEHSAKNVAGTSFGILEIMVLLILDLILLFLIISVLGFIVMIMGWAQNPLTAIRDLGWGAISALTNLILKSGLSIIIKQ